MACCTNLVKCGPILIPKPLPLDNFRIIGLDPSGGRAPWGITMLYRERPGLWHIEFVNEVKEAKITEELDHIIMGKEVYVIAIDAPIGWGFGSSMRAVDRAALAMGAKLLPPIWRGMRRLAEVGLKLYLKYFESGKAVIETHPFSASRLIGLNLKDLRRRFGKHVADSLVSAIVGAQWAEGTVITLCQSDGSLVLPLGDVEVKDGKIILFKRFKWSY